MSQKSQRRCNQRQKKRSGYNNSKTTKQLMKLRDYQQKGVEDIRQTYIKGARAPLYVLPTGGGKTVLFTYISNNAASKGKRVLILVHRVELLRQTSSTLRNFGVGNGLISPHYTPDYRQAVQVASVQTIIRRLGKMPWSPDLIIIDEAHHATAGTWRKVIEAYPQARLLGVTATPIRSDGQGLGWQAGGMFDALIEGPTTAELMERGFLVKPKIYAPETAIDFSGVGIKMGDFDKGGLAEIMAKPKIVGDVVGHYNKLCHKVPAVAFCVNVAHAEKQAQAFRDAGYSSYAVDGNTEEGERKRILAGLGIGTIDVVTSCDVISEGTDVPAIGAAMLLRRTQSEGLYLQQVGRALRPCAGKERAIILDHVGNVLMHGMPDAHRQWTLDGSTKRKGKGYKQEKAADVRQCNSCFTIHEAKLLQCPSCGYIDQARARKIEQQDGELVEYSEPPADIAKRKARAEVGLARTLEELKALAKKRGYKPNWAEHIWKARQGK